MPKDKYYNGTGWEIMDANDSDTVDGKDASEFVEKAGSDMSGALTTPQVGINTTSPEEDLDVAGNARIRSENSLKFGGTGASDSKYEIKYNSDSDSLDFNFLE